jgi:hypothetical protein
MGYIQPHQEQDTQLQQQQQQHPMFVSSAPVVTAQSLAAGTLVTPPGLQQQQQQMQQVGPSHYHQPQHLLSPLPTHQQQQGGMPQISYDIQSGYYYPSSYN